MRIRELCTKGAAELAAVATLAGQVASTDAPAVRRLRGLPSCAVPVGCDDGLPQGVQLIGARFREDLLLDAAQAIEDKAPALTPIEPRAEQHTTPAHPAAKSARRAGVLQNA